MGTQEQKEQEYYAISPFSGQSKAMKDYAEEQRDKSKNSIKQAVSDVKAHNAHINEDKPKQE
jgi:hypothetical protein